MRITPSHFDEVVALSTPHLPRSSRGPTTIPPAYRVFAVLFWLAQGGKQRVVARPVDVAESAFANHCAPVIEAMLTGLPKPEWPGCAERQDIFRDFARLPGGNAVGWRGLYADDIFRWKGPSVSRCVATASRLLHLGSVPSYVRKRS